MTDTNTDIVARQRAAADWNRRHEIDQLDSHDKAVMEEAASHIEAQATEIEGLRKERDACPCARYAGLEAKVRELETALRGEFNGSLADCRALLETIAESAQRSGDTVTWSMASVMAEKAGTLLNKVGGKG